MLSKRLSQESQLPRRNNSIDAGLDLFSAEEIEIPGLMEILLFNNGIVESYLTDIANGIKCNREINLPLKETIQQCSYKFDIAIAVAIEPGKVGIICDKSSRGNKLIKVFGGVVDSGYTGAIQVRVVNFGIETWKVKKSTAIAQLLVVNCDLEECEWVDELPRYSERGEKGFGSSDNG